MDRQRKQSGSPKMRWIIRILVIVIFVVALIITANRLMEWQERAQYERELEERKQELTDPQ